MPGKRVQLDEETWSVLRLLARDRMASFQELADEAFADLLNKHGRAADLRGQLKKSAAGVDQSIRKPSRVPEKRGGDDPAIIAPGPSGRRPRGQR
ncbi:MAG: hypothetical protein K2Y29_21540 [Beijerinckiaceae bacterium]|nr:hypothetical protein [Beijerinckiaceae bacterium]